MAGVWGKLRLHGDFLALGLDEGARACVVPWLDASLSALRDEWGEAWAPRFDAMGALGFWIGPAVAGGAPVAGVMAPSRDKVGRRYPLLILGRGEVAPPMLAPGRFHAEAGAALAGLLSSGQADPAAWPRDLGEAVAPAEPPDDPALVWARNPGCSGAEVLAEIAGYDHAAACAGRVQVWTLAAPGVALTCNGLPSAPALGWVIEASRSAAVPGPADARGEIIAPTAPGSEGPPELPPALLAGGAAPGAAVVGGIAPAGAAAGQAADSMSPFAAGGQASFRAAPLGDPPQTDGDASAFAPAPRSGADGGTAPAAVDALPAGSTTPFAGLPQGVDRAAPAAAGLQSGAGAAAGRGGADALPEGEAISLATSQAETSAAPFDGATQSSQVSAAADAALPQDDPLARAHPTATRQPPDGKTTPPAARCDDDICLAPQPDDDAGRPEVGPEAPPPDLLRLEQRFRLGADEQSDSRLVLRSEWALPEGAAVPVPVDAAIWQVAEAAPEPAPDKPKETE